MKTAREIISLLNLERHPEGGWYRETYRSSHQVPSLHGSRSEESLRAASTSIYFLLEGAEVSAFHKIESDEFWYFHEGGALTVYFLTPEGAKMHRLGGSDLSDRKASPSTWQLLVPAGTFFAAELEDKSSYALMSCHVAPGFDFRDFTLGSKAELRVLFPNDAALIERLAARP